jgi:hypothetical protein
VWQRAAHGGWVRRVGAATAAAHPSCQQKEAFNAHLRCKSIAVARPSLFLLAKNGGEFGQNGAVLDSNNRREARWQLAHSE